jgi:hypothetical protein
VAVGVLLFNDHVLKAAYPSWLTGKLSDFAGLFFFPFLLGAVVGGPAEWLLARIGRNLSSKVVGALCFAVTALWFAGMKSVPAVNAATASLTGWVIVLDPTDVIALAILLPAWRLWSQLISVESRGVLAAWRPGRAAYAALGVAVLATLATSMPAPPDKILRLMHHEDDWYVLVEPYSEGKIIIGRVVAMGPDWDEVEAVPETVEIEFAMPLTYPRVACNPDDALQCYRVSATERVEQSNDGGQTWETSWEIPPGRRRFMEYWVYFDSQMDFGPYDVTFVSVAEGHMAVVSLGAQGLLTRVAGGEWQGQPLGTAAPVPLQDDNPYLVMREFLWSFVAGGLTLFGLCRWGWRQQRKAQTQPQPRIELAAGLLITGFVLTAGLTLFSYYVHAFAWGPVVGLLVLGLGVVLWARATQTLVAPAHGWWLLIVGFVTAVIVVLIPMELFYWWVTGAIARYEVALLVSILAGAGAIALAMQLIRRMERAGPASTGYVDS